MASKEVIASSALVAVTASVTVFTALLPEFSDVRKATGDPQLTNDVRLGEAAAFGLVVAIGVTASALSDSPIPAMIAVVSAIALAIMYETVLSATPKEKANGTV